MQESLEDRIAQRDPDSAEWLNDLRSSSRSRLVFRDMEVFGPYVSKGDFFLITPTAEEASVAFASNKCIAWFCECFDNEDHVLDGRADRLVGHGVRTLDIVNYRSLHLQSMDDLKGSIDIVEDGGLDIDIQIASLDTYSVLDDFDDVDLLTMHTVLRRRCREFGFSERLPDKRLRYLFEQLFKLDQILYDDYPEGLRVANQMVKIYGNYFALGFTLETIIEELRVKEQVITKEDLARVWVLKNPNYTHIVQAARTIIGKELERLTGVDLLA